MKRLLLVALLTLASVANAQTKDECLNALGAVRQTTAVTADLSSVILNFDGQEVILTGPDTASVLHDYVRGLTLVGIEDDRGKYRVIYQAPYCAAYYFY